MTVLKDHEHQPVDSKERGPFGFGACIAVHPFTECEHRAHGGVVFIEVCECGAERRRLDNGRFEEIGIWRMPPPPEPTPTAKLIAEFLSLPKEALPSAVYVWDDELGSPWAQLRDYLKPAKSQQFGHYGQVVRLHADRDEWRDGITVKLS